MAPIQLLNVYATSMREGAHAVLNNPDALVLGIKIVGFRGRPVELTFIGWVLDQLADGLEFIAFAGFFTSSVTSVVLTEVAMYLARRKKVAGL